MKKQLQRNIEFLDKDKENLLEFGERLKFIRITLRHTQAEFAKKLGRNSSTITAYETGVIKHPKDDFFDSCAQVFNVNADYLKDGSLPMFFKEPAQLVQVELIDKTQNATPSVKESSTSKVIRKSPKTNTDANQTPKEVSIENESVEVQNLPKGDDENGKNGFTKDEFANTHQTFTHIETDENGMSVICPVKEPLNSKQLNELTKQGFERPLLKRGHIIDNLGREQKATFISEPQLYFVLMRSDKPKAKPFRQWVINEVLPQIRKQGRYEFQPNTPQQTQLVCETNKEKDKALDLALIQARNQIKLIEENKALSLENARYKALFKREGEFSLRETAKLFGINTFELKSFLIKENLITHYPNKDKQYPTQYAKDNGFVKMKLTDTKRVSYDIYLTMPLIERLKEFFGEIDL